MHDDLPEPGDFDYLAHGVRNLDELLTIRPPPPRRPSWTRVRLAERAREVAAAIDEPLTMLRFCNLADVSPATLYRHFPRGWRDLLQHAGLDPTPNRPLRWSREKLVAVLREAAATLGETPTLQGLTRVSGICAETFRRHFPDGYRELVAAAELQPPPKRRSSITDDDLLAEWDRLVRQLGRHPTWSEVTRLAHYGQSTYQNRLGGKPAIVKRHADWLER